jgi:predicted metal-dependent peptidase
MNALERIQKARIGLLFDAPFFASIAMRLVLQEDASCPTMSTNGLNIAYSPAFVETLSQPELAGVIAHEVLHVTNCHHTRRGDRDPQLWNVAADYAINDMLLQSGFKLPKGCLTGKGIDKTAEQIYSELQQQQSQQPQSGDGEPQQSQGQSQGQPQSGSGMPKPQDWGEVTDLPGADGKVPSSPAEKAQAEAEMKVAVAQAAQQAKAAGKLPAGLARLIDEIVRPRVDWREVLQRFVQSNARNDYAWMPPNRRYIHRGLYLPGLRSEELPEIVISVDTSGSIDREVLNQFSAEISAILGEYDTKVTVIYCDSAISSTEVFTSQDLPLKLRVEGGGGTDFKPPFAWVEEQGIVPACMIYLTDLECNSFPDEPPYSVLWACYGRREQRVPFGEVVTVKEV